MNKAAIILVSALFLIYETSTRKISVTETCSEYCAKQNMTGRCHPGYFEDPRCGGSGYCQCYESNSVTSDDDETCAQYCKKINKRAACRPSYFEDPRCGGRSAICTCY